MGPVDSARIAEMLQRTGDNLLKKSPVVGYLRFDRRSVVVDRPFVAVRMKLNVNSGVSQLPQLVFVDSPKQALCFDLLERDVESSCHFLQKLQATGSG